MEDEPGRHHAARIDVQHVRLAPALADHDRQLSRRRQVDVMPLALEQSVSTYGWQVALDSAVEQNVGWNCGRQGQVHLHGMPLVGPNHRAIGAQREATFIAGCNERLELHSGERLAMASERMQQRLDRNPAMWVEGYSDDSWLVA